MAKQAVYPYLPDIGIRVSELCGNGVPEGMKRDFCWQANPGFEQ